MSVNKKVIHPN